MPLGPLNAMPEPEPEEGAGVDPVPALLAPAPALLVPAVGAAVPEGVDVA